MAGLGDIGRKPKGRAPLDAIRDESVVPSTRGGLFPAAQYTDGQYHLAWPEVLATPASAIWNLDQAGTPNIVSDPEGVASLARQSFDAASMAPMGALPATLAGKGVPQGAVGIFGGRLAKTADHAALARAEELAAQGAPREHIWNDTGWFQGQDGNWRFEINDNPSKLNLDDAGYYGAMSKNGKLDDVMSHDALFAAYPELRNIRADVTRSPTDPAAPMGYGAEDYGRFDGKLMSASGQNPHSTMLHEAQHAVQAAEGFPRGSNLAAESNKFLDNKLPDGVDPFAAYRRSAGEVEARNVQTRHALVPDERRATPPWLTQDVPESDVLFANSPTGSSVPLAVNAMERKPGFTAYHGSPHDFDKFSLDKIGTGEGAQAYGHGLYFAENEGVAKSYRDALSKHPLDGAEYNEYMGLNSRYPDISPAEEARYLDLVKKMQSQPNNPGKMYEVNINADPEQFLDWDLPYHQQPENVRAALDQVMAAKANKEITPEFYGSFGSSGQGLHNLVSAWTKHDQGGTAQALREAGLPGIRYLDQGSRNLTGKEAAGSRNYVLFDDNLVDINRKYANHPLGSSVPLAFNDSEEGYASGGSVDLARITTNGGVPFTVAKAHAPQFLSLLNDLEARGYPIQSNQSGGYNDRNIAGTSTKSQHAYGNAVDVNWTDNPRGGMGKIPADLARELAKQYGFTWGGDWKNPDPMHFEVARGGTPTEHYHGDGHSHDMPQLAQAASQGDFFSDRPIGLNGDELPSLASSEAPVGMMALGGPKEEPFNAQSYRVAPEIQGRHSDFMKDPAGADWVQGPLGLMPKFSDGNMPLQGFAEGGMVGLETPLQGGNGVSGAMGELQPGYSGPLHSEIAGRTDQIPIEVVSGSYVLPADCVSALGEGNTLAGQKVVDHMFPEEEPTLQYSSGGRVPIVVAGGERVLSPEQVARKGNGNLQAGHDAIDEWVKAVRAHTIQTLTHLPPPATE